MKKLTSKTLWLALVLPFFSLASFASENVSAMNPDYGRRLDKELQYLLQYWKAETPESSIGTEVTPQKAKEAAIPHDNVNQKAMTTLENSKL